MADVEMQDASSGAAAEKKISKTGKPDMEGKKRFEVKKVGSYTRELLYRELRLMA